MSTLWDSHRKELIESMRRPFLRTQEVSARSAAISKRENSPDKLIKRITWQIKETYRLSGNENPSPEEWDSYFKVLGGGQSSRTSTAILKRMTWDQFLSEYQKICK